MSGALAVLENEAIPSLEEFRRARILREFAASFSAATGVRVDVDEIESEGLAEDLKFAVEIPAEVRR